MKHSKQKAGEKMVHTWKQAKPFLDRWRKNLANVQVQLKQPRMIDVVPIDFVGGEPVDRKGKPIRKFQGQLIYFTSDDLTIRRPSGAILMIDNYEVLAISDGKKRFEPN
jgi:hypothetical protein